MNSASQKTRINGLTFLETVESGDLAGVKFFLNNGADPNEKNRFGDPVLLLAACHGYPEIVGILLDKGADPNGPNRGNDTPLIGAACYGHSEVFRILLDGGADFEAVNNKGYSAWGAALQQGHAVIMRMLEEHVSGIEKWKRAEEERNALEAATKARQEKLKNRPMPKFLQKKP